jgi:hypothetical protein
VSSYSDLERARRGTIRWRILFALNVVPSRPLGEGLLLSVLHDAKLPLTGQDVAQYEVDCPTGIDRPPLG